MSACRTAICIALFPFSFLAVPTAGSFEVQCGGAGHYSASPSCYNWLAPERRYSGRFDLSKTTFTRMINRLENSQLQVVPSRSPLHSTLPALGPAIDILSENDMLFFYYDNDNDGRGNSDCHLYLSTKLGESPAQPMRQLMPQVDGPPCDRASLELARLYKLATESDTALLATPVERYLLTTHPDAAVSTRYEQAQLDNWLLFAKQFNLPDDLVPERGKWMEVQIPTWRSLAQEGKALSDIKEELSLVSYSEPLLRELNFDQIGRDGLIEKGLDIVVPADISGWEKIEADQRTSLELAEALYGSQEYGQLVSALRRLGSEQGIFMPMFKAPGTVDLVPVLMQAR